MTPTPRPISDFERKVQTYVRRRDSFNAEDREELFGLDNIFNTRTVLVNLKRDVEAQFIASRARLNEFLVVCNLTAAGETVEVPGVADNSGRVVEPGQHHPPATAYLIMCGREHRWKVRNVRFLALIENALEEVKNRLANNTYALLTQLLEAVDEHAARTDADRGVDSWDDDLYTIAETVRKAL